MSGFLDGAAKIALSESAKKRDDFVRTHFISKIIFSRPICNEFICESSCYVKEVEIDGVRYPYKNFIDYIFENTTGQLFVDGTDNKLWVPTGFPDRKWFDTDEERRSNLYLAICHDYQDIADCTVLDKIIEVEDGESYMHEQYRKPPSFSSQEEAKDWFDKNLSAFTEEEREEFVKNNFITKINLFRPVELSHLNQASGLIKSVEINGVECSWWTLKYIISNRTQGRLYVKDSEEFYLSVYLPDVVDVERDKSLGATELIVINCSENVEYSLIREVVDAPSKLLDSEDEKRLVKLMAEMSSQ